jgi:mannobiose 2-epimerase
VIETGAPTPPIGPEAATPAAFWPLAGTPAFARTDEAWRAALADRLERDLRRHVIAAWFPRCVDKADGGYWADFDRRWRRRGAGQRMLEFQARQTRTAARLGLALPGQRAEWARIALHGFAYTRSQMADATDGGWYWIVDRSGQPLHGGTKHAHGISYLVGACVEVYRLTGVADALAAAREVFDWLERVHHDDEYGGYHGWASRDGRPILTSADLPPGAPLHEPLGHGVGLKDANVTCDILEAFTLLAAVWPDERLLARLRELLEIVVGRLITVDGALHYMTYLDWSPVPSLERYGYLLQQPGRLLAAAALVGGGDRAMDATRSLVDHTIRRGWSSARAAVINAGPADEPNSLGRFRLRVDDLPWWVQTEAVRSILLMAMLDDPAGRYRALVDRLVATIDRDFLDHRRGGWHAEPVRDVPLRRRLRGDPAKGDDWKDASHETDMYLSGLRMLRGLSADAPLETAPG